MNARIIYMKNMKMAEEIDKLFALSQEVKEAIASVNREAFVPSGFKHSAYKLDALPIGGSQWISSPLTVAKMSEYLQPKGADSVLEIGCGSGYQAAVLSKLFRRVFTIERIDSLMREAKERFNTMGYMNIHTRSDDGQRGWASYAPYDRILFSATAKEIPLRIMEQLKEGGILVAPMLYGKEEIITRYSKMGGRLKAEKLEKCEFVPILDGTQR